MRECESALDILERGRGIVGTGAFQIGTDVLDLNGDSPIHLTEMDIQKWADWYGRWLKMDSQEKAAYQVLLALKGNQ